MSRPRPTLTRPAAALLWLGLAATAAAQPATTPQRERELVRLVRQDCGSCHGMRLTGGLGPPLTPDALADRPVEAMAATIHRGRPGTPMPGWQAMLTEAESRWIAELLARGLPREMETPR